MADLRGTTPPWWRMSFWLPWRSACIRSVQKPRQLSSLGDPSSDRDYGPKVLAVIIKHIDLEKLEVLIKSLSFGTMEMVLTALRKGYPMLAHCLDVLFKTGLPYVGASKTISSLFGGDRGSGGGGGVVFNVTMVGDFFVGEINVEVWGFEFSLVMI